jgi:hypothetical protein
LIRPWWPETALCEVLGRAVNSEINIARGERYSSLSVAIWPGVHIRPQAITARADSFRVHDLEEAQDQSILR